MSRWECADCGLVAFDLPDGVDPEFVFDRGVDGAMRCQGCASQAEGHTTVIKHGPDEDCPQCGFCDACGGNGGGGDEDEVVPIHGGLVLTLQCRPCAGSGIVCPNYEADR